MINDTHTHTHTHTRCETLFLSSEEHAVDKEQTNQSIRYIEAGTTSHKRVVLGGGHVRADRSVVEGLYIQFLLLWAHRSAVDDTAVGAVMMVDQRNAAGAARRIGRAT